MSSYRKSRRAARGGAPATVMLGLTLGLATTAPLSGCVEPGEEEPLTSPTVIEGPPVPTLRRTFAGDPGGNDTCRAIAVGVADTFVVTGEVRRIVQGHNVFTRAYQANGNPTWTRELNTPSEGNDRGSGVVALVDGAIVAGHVYSGATQDNHLLTRLSATGVPVWTRQGESPGGDLYSGVARDGSGALVVAGTVLDEAGVPRAWVRKLSADGSGEAWASVRGGTGPSAAHAIAVDAGGDVLGVGHEDTSTGRDGWISRWDAGGALQWAASVATTGNDNLVGIAVGPSGTVAVAGSLDGAALVRLYTPSGLTAWQVVSTDGGVLRGVAFDAAGNVLVTGSLGSALVVRKYGPVGVPLWQYTWPGAQGHAVAADSQSRVLVCGAEATADGSTDGLVLRYQP